MNVNDIKVQAQLQMGMTMNLQYAMRYINEAMNVLANRFDSACVRSMVGLKASEPVTYGQMGDVPYDDVTATEMVVNRASLNRIALPTGFIKVVSVLREGFEPYKDYEVEESGSAFYITFSDKGLYAVEYLRRPSDVTVDTETPQINEAYHHPMALFVASREKSKIFGDEDADALRMMQEFNRFAEEADLKLSQKKKKARFIATRLFR